MLDPDDLDEMFRLLHRWSSSLPGFPAHIVASCLGAGEWAFPLACIANACIETKSAMPKDLFLIFKELANSLGLKNDPEYTEIGEFVAVQSRCSLS